MKKYISPILALVFSTLVGITQASAQEEIWRVDGETQGVDSSQPKAKSAISDKRSLKSNSGQSKGAVFEVDAALPEEYRRRLAFQETHSVVALPDSKLKSRISGLRLGDSFDAVIQHSLIAFPDERTPVVAVIVSGQLTGERMVGEARLEPNSHLIEIEFKSLTRFAEVFPVKAVALDEDSSLGIRGEYHSQELTLFGAQFLSSMVAAYFDGLVPRQTNVFGQVQTDNSVDSAFKKGLSGGAMSSADRFKEKLKKVQEFSEKKGPMKVRVMVVGT